MGTLERFPACPRGEGFRLGKRGQVRAFPATGMAARDLRLFDRIVSLELTRRSPISVELRIRARDDIDARWLDDLEVAVNARAVGMKTGFVSMRLDDDRDPANIRLQIALGNPSDTLRPFLPNAIERLTLVSRRDVSRVYPLTDLQP